MANKPTLAKKGPTFTEALLSEQKKMEVAGFTNSLWVPEFGWTREEKEAAVSPHKPQLLAGTKCFLSFFTDVGEWDVAKCPWVHLAAEMQAGKTGVVNTLLRLIFANTQKIRITPDRVFVITGMSDNAWLKQTKDRIPLCVRNGVAHNGGLAKVVTAIKALSERPEGLCNLLIVIDESHIASSSSNRPNRMIYDEVKQLCPLNEWDRKNIRFLTISATDPAKVAAMDAGVPFYTQVVRLHTTSAYQSVRVLRDAGRLRYSEQYGHMGSEKAMAELKRVIENNFPDPLYHILRCKNGSHAKVRQELERVFPGCQVVDWNASERPSLSSSSSVSVSDINELLESPPDVHTFILLKNMFYASKTMNDEHVGVLYDRVGGKDDTNLQSLLGRACGYGKSVRTVIYTSQQTVENYLGFWQEVIKGNPTPITNIPLSKLTGKMSGIRVVGGQDGLPMTLPTHAHAAPGIVGAGSRAAEAAVSKRSHQNQDDYEENWEEFKTFEEAKAVASRIHAKDIDADGFYLSSTTAEARRLRYDEVMAMQGGKKTSNMPIPEKVGDIRYRLYVGYTDQQDPNSAIFVVRSLKRIR